MTVGRTLTATLLGLVMGGGIALPKVPDPDVDRAVLTASASKRNEGGYPERLVELLPGPRRPGEPAPAKSVVVGRVVSVEKQAAYVSLDTPGAGTEGHPCCSVEPFDVPRADWRNLLVTMEVEETLAGVPSTRLAFSWPVFGNGERLEDVAAIGRALKALGRLVVFVADSPNKPEWLGIQRQAVHLQRGILQAADDGALTMPFADGREGFHAPCCPFDEATFLAGIDTLGELRAVAKASALGGTVPAARS